MADIGHGITLGEVAGNYLSGLSSEDQKASQGEISRFARWLGRERSFSGLIPVEIENYAERLSLSDADYQKKLELLRAFLAYAKKKGWSETNMGVHLKSKRGKTKGARQAHKEAQESVSITREGHAKLEAELAGLRDNRQSVIDEIRKAAADKDFRENVPFHAAREKRGHMEGRIMEIESTLRSAVIIDDNQKSEKRVNIGDSVIICELNSEEEICYTLVGPKEVDIKKGKISSISPMGRAILGKEPGDNVEINAPVGKLHYRIKRIQH